tara:strand:+ start:387 stop:875 length:489 start_codon:yes stop_codon:yes gene_type:complete
MKISSENIKLKIAELSEDISKYFKAINAKELCVIVPMNGGVPFSVDLLREVSGPKKIFISYVLDQNGRWLFSGKKPSKNSHILIVEDIYDTGETLKELIDYLNQTFDPIDLKTVVMLDKKIKKKSFVKIDWKGFDIEDTWVYGYGMDDQDGNNRQVSYISDE